MSVPSSQGYPRLVVSKSVCSKETDKRIALMIEAWDADLKAERVAPPPPLPAH